MLLTFFWFLLLKNGADLYTVCVDVAGKRGIENKVTLGDYFSGDIDVRDLNMNVDVVLGEVDSWAGVNANFILAVLNPLGVCGVDRRRALIE